MIRSFLIRNKIKVYGRVACLGRGLFEMRYQKVEDIELVNQQKLRVDLFINFLNGAKRPRIRVLQKYMLRRDIYPLIEQQAIHEWVNNIDIPFFIMDSFSELTDQKFTHREEGWSFCCHYSDINHNSDFDKYFECNGLLPIEEIESAYMRFFEWFEREFPEKNLIYIHFPTKFDDRIIYKERSEKIHMIIKNIEKNKSYIKNIYIDDNLVEQESSDSFPYHYSKSTFSAFLDEWLRLK